MKQNNILRIILWALLLHTVWEFTQCAFLYDMWDWPFWKATIWMWAAIFGDILIVLGLWKIAGFIAVSGNFQLKGFKKYALLLGISFPASIFLEWLGIALDLWSYTREMYVVELFGLQIGLSPILQITFLPALSVYLAKKNTTSHKNEHQK